MSNIIPYFSHLQNARNTPDILKIRMKYGAEGYGIYFMILERLREDKEYMSVTDYNVIAFDLRVDASKVKAIVEDFGLFVFTEDGKYFYSETLNENMDIKDEIKRKKSEAGKKGAAKRWGNKNVTDAIAKDSTAIAQPSKNIARKEKEGKVKERVSNNTISLLNKMLKIKVDSKFLTKINSNINTDKLIEELSKSKWVCDNFNLNTVSNSFLVKLCNGEYRDFKKSNSNKFNNFKGITDDYSAEELEEVARQKQAEGFKKLGVNVDV